MSKLKLHMSHRRSSSGSLSDYRNVITKPWQGHFRKSWEVSSRWLTLTEFLQLSADGDQWRTATSYYPLNGTSMHARQQNKDTTHLQNSETLSLNFQRRFEQELTHTRTHNHITTLFLGPPGWAGARRKSSCGLHGAKGDIRGRQIEHPAGRHSIQTNQRPTSIIPPFLRRMPFLPQTSNFILARDRNQTCWIVYPVTVRMATVIPFAAMTRKEVKHNVCSCAPNV